MDRVRVRASPQSAQSFVVVEIKCFEILYCTGKESDRCSFGSQVDNLAGSAVADRPFAGAVENDSEHLPFGAAMSVLKIRSVAAQLAGCL